MWWLEKVLITSVSNFDMFASLLYHLKVKRYLLSENGTWTMPMVTSIICGIFYMWQTFCKWGLAPWMKLLRYSDFCYEKNYQLYGPFYWWDSAVSRLQSHYKESLLFTTQYQVVSGTHWIHLRNMKGWVTVEPPWGFEPRRPGLGIQHLKH